LPSTLPRWQRRLAHINHVTLYAALFLMPVAGYLGSVLSGFPVKYLGITLAAWGTKDPALKDLMSSVHYVTSWILAAAVLLHIAGALQHAIKRDGLVARMGLGRRLAMPE
jgi:cytochrome b561